MRSSIIAIPRHLSYADSRSPPERGLPCQYELGEALLGEGMAEIAETTGRADTPGRSRAVRAGVEALATQFFEPLAVDELLRDAWAGATAALLRARRSEEVTPD